MTTAWVFPGQGSQSVGMGRELFTQFAVARATFEEADDTLDTSISRLCFEGPAADLTATHHAQPALLTMSTALLRVLHVLAPNSDIPVVVAGHSLGEYSALVGNQALSFDTALRLVARRGELMAAARDGSMAAIIGLDKTVLADVCATVSANTHDVVVIANDNAPDQLVISGATSAVDAACREAKARGAKRAIPLTVSAAFHSPLMQAAAEGMREALATAHIASPTLPLIANVTALPITDPEHIRHELVDQVVSPVQWTASVRTMLEQGVTTFVEIGNGAVLTGLIKRIAPAGTTLVNLATGDDIQAFAHNVQ